MRRPILDPDIGLELDDATDAPAGLVVANESGSEEPPCRLEGRPGEESAVDDGQR
jgi:hypothetical protein